MRLVFTKFCLGEEPPGLYPYTKFHCCSFKNAALRPQNHTKGASDQEGAFDWVQVTGDTWPGVNDLPSAWRNCRASNYSDRAALLL